MRCFRMVAAVSVAMTTAALAQPPQPPAPVKQPKPAVERPVDKGPYTPAANQAYQGGGVVLQGPPGAPAPQPQATPPGQTPQSAVPQ